MKTRNGAMRVPARPLIPPDYSREFRLTSWNSISMPTRGVSEWQKPEYASDNTERGYLDRPLATAEHPPHQWQLENDVGMPTERLLAEATGS
jgi:hypothetical protein